MRIKAIKCPECGASLDIEENRKFCFCSYCGNKIMMDDEKNEVNINANITKDITYTKRYIDDADVIRAKSEEKENKRGAYFGVIVPIVCILAFACYCVIAKHSSDVQEEKFQNIIEQVMMDIENEDFDEAYIKVESIQYTADWSDDIKDKWNKTRKTLLKQIKKAEKASKRSAIFDIFD